MEVITYATKETQYYDALNESCKKFNYNLTTLGLGNKWNGMGDKILGVFDFLKDEGKEDKLYLVVDAYDVIFCRDSKDFIKEFQENFNIEDVVFNSEALPKSYIMKLLWENNYSNKHPKSDNKYEALNAGVIMGTKDKLIEFYENIINYKDLRTNTIKSDQKVIYDLFGKNKISNLKLDNKCKLFTVFTAFNNDIVYKDNKIYNKYAKTFPFLIHGAGKATVLNEHIDFLGIKTKCQKSHAKFIFNQYRADYLDYLVIIVFLAIFYKIKSSK